MIAPNAKLGKLLGTVSLKAFGRGLGPLRFHSTHASLAYSQKKKKMQVSLRFSSSSFARTRSSANTVQIEWS
jgi:hypothetical protein